MIKKVTTISLLMLSLFALQVDAQTQNIYRYKDNEGNQFIGSQVPAEFVKNGYEVINDRGQVIRVIARTLTDEERAAQAETLEAQRLEEEAIARQIEEDTLLLRLYRSPEEIIRRRDTTVEELEDQLSVFNALLRDVEENLVGLQERVDNDEAAERETPANILSQYNNAIDERDRLNRQITRIEGERETTITTAERNIARLRELLNIE